jgi:hypothetical protein
VKGCRREFYRGIPIYWVQPSRQAKASVARALSAFLNKDVSPTPAAWPLTRGEANRIIQLASDQVAQLWLHHRLRRTEPTQGNKQRKDRTGGAPEQHE